MKPGRSTGPRRRLPTPTTAISLIILAVVVFLAVAAPILWGAGADQENLDELMAGPSGRHLLGTDELGRDILARILVATRLSLMLALFVTALSVILGVTLGVLTAMVGARAGRLIGAVIDIGVALPPLLVAMFFAVVLGAGPTAAVIGLALASAPAFARLTQKMTESVLSAEYVQAARVLGVSGYRLVTRHVLANIAEPLILNATIAIGSSLLAMSGLSYLGLGVHPPQYDWGQLLNNLLPSIYTSPEPVVVVALVIALTGMAFNGLGETAAKRVAGNRVPPVRPSGQQVRQSVVSNEPAPQGALLDVRNLAVTIPRAGGDLRPVRDFSLIVRSGEKVGIVGESGSGKSTAALAIAGLLEHGMQVLASALRFHDHDLLDGDITTTERLLGSSMAFVFQDASAALNPALTVERQLTEGARRHRGLTRTAARDRARGRLKSVELREPDRILGHHSDALSGGMRQRVMIGMGLMCDPDLIIADEPTSALDVTVQQRVLAVLDQACASTGTALLFISHDIPVVRQLCERILVMYAGRVVEAIDADRLTDDAAHPYTRALLSSIPDLQTDSDARLSTVPGEAPDAAAEFAGCAFVSRCAHATDRCRQQAPELDDAGRSHPVACWNPQIRTVATGEPAT